MEGTGKLDRDQQTPRRRDENRHARYLHGTAYKIDKMDPARTRAGIRQPRRSWTFCTACLGEAASAGYSQDVRLLFGVEPEINDESIACRRGGENLLSRRGAAGSLGCGSTISPRESCPAFSTARKTWRPASYIPRSRVSDQEGFNVMTSGQAPTLTETEFDQLRAQVLQTRAQLRLTRSGGPTGPVLEGRLPEWLIPGSSDHKLDEYINRIAAQIA